MNYTINIQNVAHFYIVKSLFRIQKCDLNNTSSISMRKDILLSLMLIGIQEFMVMQIIKHEPRRYSYKAERTSTKIAGLTRPNKNRTLKD